MTVLPPELHARTQKAHEHGQDWITCLTCGAQWSDVDPPELVSDGDGHCDDRYVDAGDEALCAHAVQHDGVCLLCGTEVEP